MHLRLLGPQPGVVRRALAYTALLMPGILAATGCSLAVAPATLALPAEAGPVSDAVTGPATGATTTLAVGTGTRTAARFGAHNDVSTPFTLSHVPTLIRHRYDGRRLRLRGVEGTDPDGTLWTRHRVTYLSGRLTITGLLTVPSAPGPHPLLVLAHGYKHPDRYASGDGLRDEAEALAVAGYVALQPDYRNHAGSDREPPGRVVRRPRGYPEDLVNAIRAARRARLPFVDASRIGVFGRSMGGGVALNAAVARPDLVDALVLYAPLSSSAPDNFRRWVRPHPVLRSRVSEAYGTPRSRRVFWQQASSRRFLARLDMPVTIHHGTSDGICPVEWSRATARAMGAAGVDVTLHRYRGERHRFHARWSELMAKVTSFFDAHVRAGGG